MWSSLLLLLITSAYSFPSGDLTEPTPTLFVDKADVQVLELQKDLSLVSYIQNFKTVMAKYVSSQYGNLTVAEMDQVKDTLEEFLRCFAGDLRDTMQGTNNEDLEEGVDDGLPNATFEDIKAKIVLEFPDVDEKTAEIIVKKLRQNLFRTRQKLDRIITESQRAQIENS